jgi:hypothetical protein
LNGYWGRKFWTETTNIFIEGENLLKNKFPPSSRGEFKNHKRENFEPLYFIKGEKFT